MLYIERWGEGFQFNIFKNIFTERFRAVSFIKVYFRKNKVYISYRVIYIYHFGQLIIHFVI